jgi:hypothetical protein
MKRLCCALIVALLPALSYAANFKIAKLQVLNKVTARVSELEVKPLLPSSIGALDIEIKQCWHSPNDARPEQAALMEIRERKSEVADTKLLFSGWMFQSSPALSALEHPVYDVSVIRCE